MDCCVRVFYGESVRREDGMFEDMEEELEWFDEPPSFSDLCVCLKGKFGDDFTLKGRFDSGKTRAHYVLMPFRDHAHWSRYNRVIQGFNVAMAEVVVENALATVTLKLQWYHSHRPIAPHVALVRTLVRPW